MLINGGNGRRPAQATVWRRMRVAAGAVAAGVLGLAPHVLHHAGPLAGAAIVAGATGTVLFGFLGLLAAVPMLLRMKKRTGSWKAPIATLILFATLFAVSTTVVGPAITGDDDGDAPARESLEHEEHHP